MTCPLQCLVPCPYSPFSHALLTCIAACIAAVPMGCSSMAERSTVNRVVGGSTPPAPVHRTNARPVHSNVDRARCIGVRHVTRTEYTTLLASC